MTNSITLTDQCKRPSQAKPAETSSPSPISGYTTSEEGIVRSISCNRLPRTPAVDISEPPQSIDIASCSLAPPTEYCIDLSPMPSPTNKPSPDLSMRRPDSVWDSISPERLTAGSRADGISLGLSENDDTSIVSDDSCRVYAPCMQSDEVLPSTQSEGIDPVIASSGLFAATTAFQRTIIAAPVQSLNEPPKVSSDKIPPVVSSNLLFIPKLPSKKVTPSGTPTAMMSPPIASKTLVPAIPSMKAIPSVSTKNEMRKMSSKNVIPAIPSITIIKSVIHPVSVKSMQPAASSKNVIPPVSFKNVIPAVTSENVISPTSHQNMQPALSSQNVTVTVPSINVIPPVSSQNTPELSSKNVIAVVSSTIRVVAAPSANASTEEIRGSKSPAVFSIVQQSDEFSPMSYLVVSPQYQDDHSLVTSDDMDMPCVFGLYEGRTPDLRNCSPIVPSPQNAAVSPALPRSASAKSVWDMLSIEQNYAGMVSPGLHEKQQSPLNMCRFISPFDGCIRSTSPFIDDEFDGSEQVFATSTLQSRDTLKSPKENPGTGKMSSTQPHNGNNNNYNVRSVDDYVTSTDGNISGSCSRDARGCSNEGLGRSRVQSYCKRPTLYTRCIAICRQLTHALSGVSADPRAMPELDATDYNMNNSNGSSVMGSSVMESGRNGCMSFMQNGQYILHLQQAVSTWMYDRYAAHTAQTGAKPSDIIGGNQNNCNDRGHTHYRACHVTSDMNSRSGHASAAKWQAYISYRNQCNGDSNSRPMSMNEVAFPPRADIPVARRTLRRNAGTLTNHRHEEDVRIPLMNPTPRPRTRTRPRIASTNRQMRASKSYDAGNPHIPFHKPASRRERIPTRYVTNESRTTTSLYDTSRQYPYKTSRSQWGEYADLQPTANIHGAPLIYDDSNGVTRWFARNLKINHQKIYQSTKCRENLPNSSQQHHTSPRRCTKAQNAKTHPTEQMLQSQNDKKQASGKHTDDQYVKTSTRPSTTSNTINKTVRRTQGSLASILLKPLAHVLTDVGKVLSDIKSTYTRPEEKGYMNITSSTEVIPNVAPNTILHTNTITNEPDSYRSLLGDSIDNTIREDCKYGNNESLDYNNTSLSQNGNRDTSSSSSSSEDVAQVFKTDSDLVWRQETPRRSLSPTWVVKASSLDCMRTVTLSRCSVCSDNNKSMQGRLNSHQNYKPDIFKDFSDSDLGTASPIGSDQRSLSTYVQSTGNPASAQSQRRRDTNTGEVNNRLFVQSAHRAHATQLETQLRRRKSSTDKPTIPQFVEWPPNAPESVGDGQLTDIDEGEIVERFWSASSFPFSNDLRAAPALTTHLYQNEEDKDCARELQPRATTHSPKKDNSRDNQIRAEEDRVSAKEDNVRAKEDNISANEDNVRANEDNVRAKEDNVSANEDNVSAKEEKIRAKEEKIRAKEDNASANEDNVSAYEDNVRAKEDNVSANEEKIRAKEDRDNTKADKLSTKNDMGSSTTLTVSTDEDSEISTQKSDTCCDEVIRDYNDYSCMVEIDVGDQKRYESVTHVLKTGNGEELIRSYLRHRATEGWADSDRSLAIRLAAKIDRRIHQKRRRTLAHKQWFLPSYCLGMPQCSLSTSSIEFMSSDDDRKDVGCLRRQKRTKSMQSHSGQTDTMDLSSFLTSLFGCGPPADKD